MRLGNGLELYRFRYKGSDDTFYVGVMAQEVQKIGLKFMTWKQWLERTSN